MQALVLTRQVNVSKFDVLMEIGRQERREELHAILMIAARLGRVTPSDICSELFPGRPETFGKVYIDRCGYLDLLDHKGALTESGEQALRTSKVFVPEKGRYVVWYTEDELLQQKLLHLEPVPEIQAHDEIAMARPGNRYPKDGVPEKTENVSEKFSPLEGRALTLIGPGGGLVTIRKVDPNGLPKKLESSDSLKVTLTLSQSGASRLTLEGKFQQTLQTPEINFEEAWVEALGPLATSWAESRRPPALKVAFAELKEIELSSFMKTIQLSRPRLARFGVFDDVSVKDVPIIPERQTDANQWAEWLLERSITGYTDDELFQERVKACELRFPDFTNLKLSSAEELALKLRKQRTAEGRLPPRYWFLQAPRDLRVDFV